LNCYALDSGRKIIFT